MLLWITRRLLTSLLLVFLLLSAVFFVVRLAPGDPLDQVVENEFGAADRELLRESLGLGGTMVEQYGRWLRGIMRGDLGQSLRQHRPVTAIIKEALPATLLLTVTAYFWHLILAVGSALVMAVKVDRLADRLLTWVGLLFFSLPGFWLGLMFIMVFCRKLGWFPAAGIHSPDAAFMSWGRSQLDLWWHLALPAATLALGSFMGTARYLRSSLLEVLDQDYILAARSRGLPERVVLLRHALGNALLPLITLMGLSVPFLLGGAVVIEIVFGWPGMGRVTIEAVWARDYPVIMATTSLGAVTVVLGSFLADLLYGWADPRVRLGGRERAS